MSHFPTIHIPFFTKRAARRQAKREAEIRRMQNSPIVKIGSFKVVNPAYRGPNPYRGPEVTDPKNKGKQFIFIHGSKGTAPQTIARFTKPKSPRKRTIRWAQ